MTVIHSDKILVHSRLKFLIRGMRWSWDVGVSLPNLLCAKSEAAILLIEYRLGDDETVPKPPIPLAFIIGIDEFATLALLIPNAVSKHLQA